MSFTPDLRQFTFDEADQPITWVCTQGHWIRWDSDCTDRLYLIQRRPWICRECGSKAVGFHHVHHPCGDRMRAAYALGGHQAVYDLISAGGLNG